VRYGVIDGEPVAYIPLTQGYWATIDREDLSKVPGKWIYSAGYAVSGSIYMHNVIMPPPDGMETDHKFSNGLDNRKSQLRYATHQQNTCNRKLNVNNKSGYKGVSWNRSSSKWEVRIRAGGIHIHIGYFKADKLIEAAKAYDAAAIKYHGEYARLNFPVGGDD
jgi:hypothetical protein